MRVIIQAAGVGVHNGAEAYHHLTIYLVLGERLERLCSTAHQQVVADTSIDTPQALRQREGDHVIVHRQALLLLTLKLGLCALVLAEVADSF